MKVYKTYELIKAMFDGEIEDGTKFKVKYFGKTAVYDSCDVIYNGKRLMWNNKEIDLREPMLIDTLLDVEQFEIIEEDKPIEELKGISKYFKETKLSNVEYNLKCIVEENVNKINEIVKAVNELKKESEK